MRQQSLGNDLGPTLCPGRRRALRAPVAREARPPRATVVLQVAVKGRCASAGGVACVENVPAGTTAAANTAAVRAAVKETISNYDVRRTLTGRRRRRWAGSASCVWLGETTSPHFISGVLS